jgi:hypothetical protein
LVELGDADVLQLFACLRRSTGAAVSSAERFATRGASDDDLFEWLVVRGLCLSKECERGRYRGQSPSDADESWCLPGHERIPDDFLAEARARAANPRRIAAFAIQSWLSVRRRRDSAIAGALIGPRLALIRGAFLVVAMQAEHIQQRVATLSERNSERRQIDAGSR